MIIIHHIFFFFFFFALQGTEKVFFYCQIFLFLLIINETVKPALIYFVKRLEGYMSNSEEKKTKSNCIFVF